MPRLKKTASAALSQASPSIAPPPILNRRDSRNLFDDSLRYDTDEDEEGVNASSPHSTRSLV